MSRYLMACNGDSRKAMTLYRMNLRLSQEMFTIISCFEVALRNKIDQHFLSVLGKDWLQNSASAGGIFDNKTCRATQLNINEAINKLNNTYTHNKLVAALGFGFWRYMFAHQQFAATGRNLLRIFPAKPKTTIHIQYNHTYVFNLLASINDVRNRIAHHEPICFLPGKTVTNTNYARHNHLLILQLFNWMGINESQLLYGLDHIIALCDQIDGL